MKVKLVNHRYHPFHGGSEIYIKTIAEWLAGRGVDARVTTSNAHDLEYFWDRSARPVDAPANEKVDGIPVTRLGVRHMPGIGKLAFPIARRLMAEASPYVSWATPYDIASKMMPLIDLTAEAVDAGWVPDVVFATNLGLEGLAARAAGRASKYDAKLVLVPFAHVGGVGTTALRYISMPHQRELLGRADLILTMTSIEAGFVESLGVDPWRVRVVGAGVDPAAVSGGRAAAAKLRLDDEEVLVGAIGALAEDKGTIDLIESMASLVEHGMNLRLVLVGPEMSAFSRWLARRGADTWPWLARTGVIDEAQKRDILAALDILALPSRTESFGIVFLEAWANGKPVVAAAVGAVNEVVDDGADGVLVPFGDRAALASAVRQLAISKSTRARMGAAGRFKVDEKYTWTQVLGRIECSFRDVLGIELGNG